jgi:hypothetical protein
MPDIPKSLGNENRSSILPTTTPDSMGFFGSPYSPADALIAPATIGVRAGDSLESVVNAVKGVGYYVDMIGFGGPSSAITQGMPLKPLGVNYFMNTGQTCSNGATMYQYFEGIPTGGALGPKVQRAIRQMGLPGLQGLAPGMMEDAENALNPIPLMTAMLGSGYPQCKRVALPVGDMYGNIRDPDTKVPWIEHPEDAIYLGKKGKGPQWYQERWVQDTDNKGNPITLDKDTWTKTPKIFNPDGTPIKRNKEGFETMMTATGTVVVVGILAFLAFGMIGSRQK